MLTLFALISTATVRKPLRISGCLFHTLVPQGQSVTNPLIALDMKLLETLHALFPMSKGAFLACTAIAAGGYVQTTAINDTLKEVVTLQRETNEQIHQLDLRMTVVETKLEVRGVQVQHPDSIYSNPREISF